MRTKQLEFTGHDQSTLAARLDLPTGKPLAYALFAHCFTCSKDSAAARKIAQRLASLGIAVLRFDFTGLGHSAGDFSDTTFSSNVKDLVLAAQYMEAKFQAPQVLIGHSLGGAAILAAAKHIPQAKAVITMGSPIEPAHVSHLFSQQLDTIESHGSTEVTLGKNTFTIKKEFLDDIAATSIKDDIGTLKKALLVLHAPLDNTVGIENASQIFQQAKHPKSFITLDDADHLLSNSKDASYAAEMIASWVQRYIDVDILPTPINAPEGVVRVQENDAGSFTQNISADGHPITADEPVNYGGDYLGPTPYQLVSAGLGACTSMTIRMYANRKNIPLEKVEVDITHDKIYAKDCESCEQGSGKIDQFKRRITLLGDINEEDQQRLLSIADRCPVHRTLESEVEIVTEKVDG